MAGEQRKTGRSARAAYFTRAVSGEYIYNGPLYRPKPGQKLTWRQAMTLRWVMGAAAVGLTVLCGCLPLAGMTRAVYVIAPYMCQFIAGGMLLWAVGKMTGGGDGLREYVFDASVPRLPGRAAAMALFSVLTAIGEGVSLLKLGDGSGNRAAVIVFFAAQLIVFVISLIWRRMERGILWEK